MEYVYLLEYRHPDWIKGEWRMVLIAESEHVCMNFWFPEYASKQKWYRQGNRLYCRTHYSSGEPVTYRIVRHSFYTEQWLKGQKKIS